jgi:GNAT superfamily N-acetyltransferase
VARFKCVYSAVFYLATEDGQRIGAAKGLRYSDHAEYVDMLNGRTDIAVLADIRVALSHKGHGIGRSLFDSVATWARSEACA